jgi:hypothetical protein
MTEIEQAHDHTKAQQVVLKRKINTNFNTKQSSELSLPRVSEYHAIESPDFALGGNLKPCFSLG